MGLDMYLTGEKYHCLDPENNPMEDGFEVKSRTLRLGYWRKHPDLHGYIVANFAEGVDQCQRIELFSDRLVELIGSVEQDLLPKTSGFFFGCSCPEDKAPTLEILRKALAWLDEYEPGVLKSVYCQASW